MCHDLSWSQPCPDVARLTIPPPSPTFPGHVKFLKILVREKNKTATKHLPSTPFFVFKCLVQWLYAYFSVAPPSPPATSRRLSLAPSWSSVPVRHLLPVSWDAAPGAHPLLGVSGAFNYVRSVPAVQYGDSPRLRLCGAGLFHSTSGARASCTWQPVPRRHSLRWLSHSPLYRQTDHVLFFPPSPDGHEGFSHLSAAVCHAALTGDVQTSFQDPAFPPFGSIPGVGMVASYRRPIVDFFF